MTLITMITHTENYFFKIFALPDYFCGDLVCTCTVIHMYRKCTILFIIENGNKICIVKHHGSPLHGIKVQILANEAIISMPN